MIINIYQNMIDFIQICVSKYSVDVKGIHLSEVSPPLQSLIDSQTLSVIFSVNYASAGVIAEHLTVRTIISDMTSEHSLHHHCLHGHAAQLSY